MRTTTTRTETDGDVTRPVDWDSPDWGRPGFNVHHGTTDDLGGPNDREQVSDR